MKLKRIAQGFVALILIGAIGNALNPQSSSSSKTTNDASATVASSASSASNSQLYYVGSDGKMLKDATTPDGYYVNKTGKWDGKPLPANDRNTAIPSNFEKATVVRVVDGDTIVVNRGNGKEKVRLILVNTPETKHPRKGVEYYGKEASNFTKSQLKGRTVYLEKDTSERDRYKRLLRYVWLDIPANQSELGTKCFNAILLREGYAYLSTFPPDVKYVHEFRKFEAEARNKGAGLWG